MLLIGLKLKTVSSYIPLKCYLDNHRGQRMLRLKNQKKRESNKLGIGLLDSRKGTEL